MPLGFFIVLLTPFGLPPRVGALAVTVGGLPVSSLVRRQAGRLDLQAWSSWGLRAQVWLQVGGALLEALRLLRNGDDFSGRHAAD